MELCPCHWRCDCANIKKKPAPKPDWNTALGRGGKGRD
jgi:hypothetical protein